MVFLAKRSVFRQFRQFYMRAMRSTARKHTPPQRAARKAGAPPRPREAGQTTAKTNKTYASSPKAIAVPRGRPRHHLAARRLLWDAYFYPSSKLDSVLNQFRTSYSSKLRGGAIDPGLTKPYGNRPLTCQSNCHLVSELCQMLSEDFVRCCQRLPDLGGHPIVLSVS